MAGAETLSVEAMRREIEEKSQDGDHLLQQLARERAGLSPVPTDTSRMTPYERMQRAYLQLGDQSEAAVAKRLGPERARQIRSPEGWGSRSQMAGCPK
ncbi:MAG: hypothetical protein JWP01_3318 [Myxococcales bacterium]|nr:hypothetical protein [Myxococcales bacterium]